jgi:hypothetical protein
MDGQQAIRVAEVVVLAERAGVARLQDRGMRDGRRPEPNWAGAKQPNRRGADRDPEVEESAIDGYEGAGAAQRPGDFGERQLPA